MNRTSELADISTMLRHGPCGLNVEYIYQLRQEAVRLSQLRERYQQLLERNRRLESRVSSMEVELLVYELGSRVGTC